MKRMGILLVVLCVITGMMGCTTTTKRKPGLPLGGIELEELTRDQYVIMDTVEGTGTVTRILFLVLPLNQRLGYTSMAAASGQMTATQLIASMFMGGNLGEMAKAAGTYDCLAQVPDADGILPLSSTVEKTGIPIIYRVMTGTVKAKGIRVKTDSDMGF